MSGDQEDVHALRLRIQKLEAELSVLTRRLAEVEVVDISEASRPVELSTLVPIDAETPPEQPIAARKADDDWRWPLDADEYRRYGRQMIMPEIGLEGQLKLKDTSVLIVGIGGLGCPAACYLAGAGIGTLGLMDGDKVETSNLHRQILHSSATVGQLKVFSAIENLRQLNPKVHYRAHPFNLEPRTALDVIDQYDVILDCTDHPTSRYLISDAAVIARKPLVSASALRTEGQLLVLNWPPRIPETKGGGFCYRCVFPKPPPLESVIDCGAGGILGPVVGVMGVLMAIETIKITVRLQSLPQEGSSNPCLLLYSAFSYPNFRSIRLRGKRPACPSCSPISTINRQSLSSGSLDYAAFCGVTSISNILPSADRISAIEYSKIHHEAGQGHFLVDVRENPQFDICHLQHSLNIPYSSFPIGFKEQSAQESTASDPVLRKVMQSPGTPIYILCRFGNDSQLVVQKMKAWAQSTGRDCPIRDIRGGLEAWRKEVDPKFPEY